MRKRLTTEEFVERAKSVHSGKYDYSKVNYVNEHVEVCIICPEHGEFWQLPQSHLKGCGCKKCKGLRLSFSKRSNIYTFIKKAKYIHNSKYDYSKVKYINNKTKVCIICPEHGEFWQTPNSHLKGSGCALCSKNVKLTTEQFIEKAKKVHGDRYDYSKVKYVNYDNKVCITCSKHGEFWQEASNHLQGKGCPHCSESNLEKDVTDFLVSNGIKFDYNKTKVWLNGLRLDFYLPDYNIGIECQGKQHFEPVDFAGKGKEWAELEFNKTIYRDNKKRKLCENNNTKLLYYLDNNKNNFFNFLKNEII